MGIPDKKNANQMVGRTAARTYDEDGCVRHAKRRREALKVEKQLKSWLADIGVDLQIRNNGHHWQMRNENKFSADWWPSSAKFVINKNFHDGIHVHGVDQIAAILADHLKIDRPTFAVQSRTTKH